MIIIYCGVIYGLFFIVMLLELDLENYTFLIYYFDNVMIILVIFQVLQM